MKNKGSVLLVTIIVIVVVSVFLFSMNESLLVNKITYRNLQRERLDFEILRSIKSILKKKPALPCKFTITTSDGLVKIEIFQVKNTKKFEQKYKLNLSKNHCDKVLKIKIGKKRKITEYLLFYEKYPEVTMDILKLKNVEQER